MLLTFDFVVLVLVAFSGVSYLEVIKSRYDEVPTSLLVLKILIILLYKENSS